jgi:hypothetical protein
MRLLSTSICKHFQPPAIVKTLHTFFILLYSIIVITLLLHSILYCQFNYIVSIVKRRCANTIIDNRQLADDSLPYSELKIYTNKLILCKPDVTDSNGDPVTVQYSYRQRGCNAV